MTLEPNINLHNLAVIVLKHQGHVSNLLTISNCNNIRSNATFLYMFSCVRGLKGDVTVQLSHCIHDSKETWRLSLTSTLCMFLID